MRRLSSSPPLPLLLLLRDRIRKERSKEGQIDSCLQTGMAETSHKVPHGENKGERGEWPPIVN